MKKILIGSVLILLMSSNAWAQRGDNYDGFPILKFSPAENTTSAKEIDWSLARKLCDAHWVGTSEEGIFHSDEYHIENFYDEGFGKICSIVDERDREEIRHKKEEDQLENEVKNLNELQHLRRIMVIPK